MRKESSGELRIGNDGLISLKYVNMNLLQSSPSLSPARDGDPVSELRCWRDFQVTYRPPAFL